MHETLNSPKIVEKFWKMWHFIHINYRSTIYWCSSLSSFFNMACAHCGNLMLAKVIFVAMDEVRLISKALLQSSSSLMQPINQVSKLIEEERSTTHWWTKTSLKSYAKLRKPENQQVSVCKIRKQHMFSVDDLIEYIVCNADFRKLIQRHLSVVEDFHACHAEFWVGKAKKSSEVVVVLARILLQL